MNQEFIIRYLTKNLTPEEVAQLVSWVEASDANRNEFAGIKNAWAVSSMSGTGNIAERNRKYSLLSEKILHSNTAAIPPPRLHKTKRFRQIAATLILTAGISSLAGYYLAKSKENIPSQLNVANGKQTCLTLSDGTRIWLNSGSSIQYPSAFRGKSRNVTLQGEAYFEVAHNKSMPFIVHTSDVNIKVLGTSFNLSSYADDDVTRLTLEKGSVSIIRTTDGKELARVIPGQMATYSKPNQALKMEVVDTRLFSSWKEGQFKFRKMSFEEIAKKLGRQYNVRFVFINKNMKTITYNGSFYNYEPFESVLKLMQRNSSFNYVIKRDTIYIK